MVILQVAFDFIGRRVAIDNAKHMLEYHMDHLRDVEAILQIRREMDPENDTPTYYQHQSQAADTQHGPRGRRRYCRSPGGREGRQHTSG